MATTYVLMTKLTPPRDDDTKSTRERGHEWKMAVEKACPGVKFIAHYALLGPYDFMDIYEAPDESTAFKVSLISRAKGAVSAESWPAVRYGALLEIMDAVEAV
jgi:uncharacterized protein with GYD domain